MKPEDQIHRPSEPVWSYSLICMLLTPAMSPCTLSARAALAAAEGACQIDLSFCSTMRTPLLLL